MSQKNFLRTEKTFSPRGNILDTNGRLIATNRPITNLYWHGTGRTRLNEEDRLILSEIDNILNTELCKEKEKEIAQAEKQEKEILLAQELTSEELSRIAEKFSGNKNICLATHFKRHYPYKNLACHLVGYLGNIDYEESGKMGLEKILEETLKGKVGEVQKTINSLGKNLTKKKLSESLAGGNIKTTLDLDLQTIVERIFSDHYVGTMIIMDPKTGALRALVSRPNFDPNIFLRSINQNEWQELQEKNVFLNRAFNACYPPASIFKLVTVSAALEQEIISPAAEVICKGFYTFGKHKHWCINHYGHGVLTAMEAVAKSCNILFYHIGQHIHIDTLADYARRFGLGQKTNMLFPDQAGLIPTTQWKRAKKGERWWPGETLSASIGQSFLLTTPIQLACMVSSIFEEYLVKPRVLEDEIIEKTPLKISKSTLEFLRQSMRSVVQMGTGKRVSKMKDLEVYAKTGTAQTSSLKLRQSNEKFMENGLFVGYFKYKDENPNTIIIIVEHVGSSRIATSLGKEFLVAYRTFYENKDLKP